MAKSVGAESEDFVASLQDDPDLAVLLHSCLNRPLEPPSVTVLHGSGDQAERTVGAAATVMRTRLEADSLPPGWADRLNLVDEVWVGSEFNRATFLAAGVRTPIHVVPGGVDATRFRPGLKALDIPGARGTVFLSVFTWQRRKAPDVLLRAWCAAFGPEDPASLVIHCTVDSGGTMHPADLNRLVDAELSKLGRTRREVAPIVVLPRALGHRAMPQLFSAADVYVGVTPGEGFGRPLLEAMACGLPTIGTRWGGNTDFMTDENSFLVDVEGLVEIDHTVDYGDLRGQRWAEPSAEHLSSLLREAAADEKLRSRLGRRARTDVEKRWQWQQVSRVAENRLRELSGNTGRPKGLSPTGSHDLRPRVRWIGDIYADHSLATVNRELVTRLTSSGRLAVEAVSAELPPFPPDHAAALSGVAGAGTSRHTGPVALEVRHSWPHDFSPSPNAVAMILPWEFGGLPGDWLRGLATIDEVWAPTRWVRDCYLRSGLASEKVVVVPNGVDTTTFRPHGPRLSLENRCSRRLLFVGGLISRKGFDILLQAYRLAFRPHDDICLVVKPFGTDTVYRHASMVRELMEAVADPNVAPIEVIDRRLSKLEMAALYRSCDVLVHPYRGEGFGLPVAEAMACGVPVVATDYGACRDFADATTGWLVPAKEIPVQLSGTEPGPAGFWWAEPDRDHLVELLRRASSGEEEIRALGAAAAARIAAEWTWDAAASVAHSRLAELTGVPETALAAS